MRAVNVWGLSLLLLLSAGCWRTGDLTTELTVTVSPVEGLPVYALGAAATWTTSGFLVLPSPLDESPALEPQAPAPRGGPKIGLLYSPRTGALRPLPGQLPESPPFIGAEPLDDGTVVFAGLGGFQVDLATGTWSPLEGGPVGNLVIDAHASRPGVVFVYGRVPNGACAAWEYRQGELPWTELPRPPCSSFTRIASDGARWWVFAYDFVAKRLDAASFGAGDNQWQRVPLGGAPDELGAITAADGWLAAQGTTIWRTPFVNVGLTTGIFALRAGRWAVLDADADGCAWGAAQIAGDLLVAMGEGTTGCAWDLPSGRRFKDFALPQHDLYVRGVGATLGWGRTTRSMRSREEVVVRSAAATLIEWKVARSSL